MCIVCDIVVYESKSKSDITTVIVPQRNKKEFLEDTQYCIITPSDGWLSDCIEFS